MGKPETTDDLIIELRCEIAHLNAKLDTLYLMHLHLLAHLSGADIETVTETWQQSRQEFLKQNLDDVHIAPRK